MKILIACNIILPRVAEKISKQATPFGGWIVGLTDALLKNSEVDLTIASPGYRLTSIASGAVDNLKYFCYPQKRFDITNYNQDIEEYAKRIITQTEPNVVHIFGTEYPHTLAIVNACGQLGIINRAVINMQGLVSVLAKHYYAGLPGNIVRKSTFRNIIMRDNIRQQKKGFEKCGKYEIEALKKVKHVIGRTDWDRACTSQINPQAQYHFCNESLRDEFYSHNWDIAKCERYSIFISQAGYPIKGLHFVLEALPEVIKKFPEAHLYIAGDDITKTDSLRAKIIISSYGVYIKNLIQKYDLHNNITFTGVLDERAMCERFLKSHVFVSSSSIENESNSISEAKLLGVPVIASFAGGVTGRLMHSESGFFYQHDAPYMLAYYICKVFSKDELALKFSENAKKHAEITHCREKNLEVLHKIYEDIRY